MRRATTQIKMYTPKLSTARRKGWDLTGRPLSNGKVTVEKVIMSHFQQGTVEYGMAPKLKQRAA